MSKRYLQGVTLLIGLGDADAIQLNLRNTSGFVGNVFDSLAWICTVSLRLILYSVHGLYYVLDLSTCFVLSVNLQSLIRGNTQMGFDDKIRPRNELQPIF